MKEEAIVTGTFDELLMSDPKSLVEQYKIVINDNERLREIARDVLDNYITVCCNYGQEYDDIVNNEIVQNWMRKIEYDKI